MGAQATIFALLLDPGEAVRRTQLAWLDAYALPAAVRETRLLIGRRPEPGTRGSASSCRNGRPALCQMTPAQFHDFIRCVEALVHADHKMTLFEFTLQRLLIRHVVTHFVKAGPAVVKFTTASPLSRPVAIILSALAYASEQSPEGVQRAFAAVAAALDWPSVRIELAHQPPSESPPSHRHSKLWPWRPHCSRDKSSVRAPSAFSSTAK